MKEQNNRAEGRREDRILGEESAAGLDSGYNNEEEIQRCRKGEYAGGAERCVNSGFRDDK